MSGLTGRLRAAAEQTPPRRQRHVDLLRAVAILAVVLGHWLVIAVTETDDELDGINALKAVEWAHPLTWLFQVMPLFFFVGGYANAASLQAHRRRHGDAVGWVLGRHDRLLRPSTALLGVLALSVAAATWSGVDPDLASTGAWLATVPLWFLVAYMAVLVLAPLGFAAHLRWGVAVPLVLALLVAVGDLARLGIGVTWGGDANHLLAWLAIHQLGFAWRTGDLPATPGVGLPLAAGALVVGVFLVVAGPYPVSMVGVPGDDLQNNAPPTLALLALGVAQVGVALALCGSTRRWLHRRRPWLGVVAVNGVILTVFLWHMTAAGLAAIALHGTGLVPVPEVGTTDWWLLRVPWLLAATVALGVLVALFAPIELSTPSVPPGLRAGRGPLGALVTAATLGVLVSLLGIVVAGPGRDGPFGLPTWALAAYGLSVATLAIVQRRLAARASPR